MVRTIVLSVVVLVGILGLAWLVLILTRNANEADKRNAWLAAACAAIPLVVGALMVLWPDSSGHDSRPMVTARLVIERGREGGYLYAFDVENTGSTPATALEFGLIADDVAAAATTLHGPKDLPPRTTIRIEPNPLKARGIETRPFSFFDLVIAYKGEGTWSERSFASRFKFRVNSDAELARVYPPHSADHVEGGTEWASEFKRRAIEFGLQRAEATAIFQFVEPAEQLPTLIYEGGRLRVIWNAPTREVVAQVIDAENRFIRELVLPVAPTFREHLVIVRWQPAEALLRVDGEEVRMVPAEPKAIGESL